MALTLRDKVELYENFLKSIASTEWDVNINHAPDYVSKDYAYSWGMGTAVARLRRCVEEAQFALNQGKK